MKIQGCGAVWAAVITLFVALPVQAQNLEEGDWTALMLTPGGEIGEAVYEVQHVGTSAQATMRWNTGETIISNLHLEEDLLTFDWDPGFYMSCRLERQSNRQFKGSCMDGRENVGPWVLSPPGVPVSRDDLDLDKAFELWNLSREEYIEERYPQPNTRRIDYEEPEPLPSKTVDVGGTRINVVETGKGDVTVVLEGSIADDHQIWRHVQEAVSSEARVVSYDRPGLGLSDPAAAPRSADVVVRELRDLLDAAGYAPPYVLVGHGTGALTVRRFQQLHPADVAGLVLVDPTHKDEDEVWSDLDAASWDDYLNRKRTFYSMISTTAEREFDAYVDALTSEDLNGQDANVPVVVLSGLRAYEEPRWVGETADGLAAKEQLHRELADELNGRFIGSAESGSYMHLEKPQLVADAIEDVLDSVKK